MNRTRIIIAAVALFLAAGALLPAWADEEKANIRHTFIVRDGKVVEMDGKVVEIGDIPFFQGKRAYIGVKATSLSPELREHFGVDRSAGILVSSVEKGSPADKAGLEVGDIITAVDGKTVDDVGDLRQAIAKKHRGDSVRLDATRGKSKQSLVATVDEHELGPGELFPGDFFDIGKLEGLRAFGNAPEWRGKVMTFGPDCNDLQDRIKVLENRLKELEKKLEK